MNTDPQPWLLLAIFFAAQCPWVLGLLFLRLVRMGSPGLFWFSRCPFGFFSWRFYVMISIFVDLLHLGGDPCWSVGDQPPLPTPRGDPARLGTLSADTPCCSPLLLLRSSSTPYHFMFFFCNTRWGRVASTPCRSESSNISLVVFVYERIIILFDLLQCCGTVTIYYGSSSGSGSDFWKVMVPVPVPTFEKFWFRFRFRFLLLKKLRFRFWFRFQLHI